MDYPREWETTFKTKTGLKLFFRPEQPSDTEMLWEMFSTLSDESASNLLPPFTRERVEGWTRDINYNEVLAVVAVIEENGEKHIVGSASLKFNPQKAIRHKAELGITVHDNYQNLGIGSALLRHMLDVAAMKKLTKVWLQVNTDNAHAIHVYTKAGFMVEAKLGKESCINGKYRDEYRMALFM